MNAEHFFSGNSLRLLKNGAEYFPALAAAIDGAREEIYLETYIFEYDDEGKRIGQALMRAAGRGIAVHLLLDGFGCRGLPQQVEDELTAAGVRVLFFGRQISPWTLRRSRLKRLHRKLAVVDAKIAFVGGINIIHDQHFPGIRKYPLAEIPPRFDYAVEVRGQILAEIHGAVMRLWALRAWMHFGKRTRLDFAPRRFPPQGNQVAAFVMRDNIRHRRNIELAYLHAISQAKREIIIANAYFFPGPSIRHALTAATARGVRVVLLLQGRVEYVLLHYATRALYGNLLAAGIEIHEYHRSYMHAKVAVIDGHWATVGSSNIDPFSLLLAREANVVVRDEAFAGELRESLLAAIDNDSSRMLPDSWAKEPLKRRIMIWLSYGFVRFLMGMAGYGRDHEFR